MSAVLGEEKIACDQGKAPECPASGLTVAAAFMVMRTWFHIASCFGNSVIYLSRSALPMTEAELRLIANAAIMGESSHPVTG